jgi:outer membrane scaffolding protein for murein synthesis (MipA/OmpV family)
MLLRTVLAGLLLLAARCAVAQTPSPLAYWQYGAGELLASQHEEEIPEWAITLGAGLLTQPAYEGATRYKVLPSVAVDIRYRDIAFASDGEGLGVNLLRGKNYRAGVAIGYDLGRDQHDDPHLRNLGSIDPAPEGKVFAEYFLLPVMLSATLHQAIGGHNGLLLDLGAYVPIPLFDERLIIFTGPATTIANGHYMREYFGVNATQSAASGLRQFTAHAGFKSAGWGATAIYRITDEWMVDCDLAFERLLGDAERSPVVQNSSQFTAILNLDYHF